MATSRNNNTYYTFAELAQINASSHSVNEHPVNQRSANERSTNQRSATQSRQNQPIRPAPRNRVMTFAELLGAPAPVHNALRTTTNTHTNALTPASQIATGAQKQSAQQDSIQKPRTYDPFDPTSEPLVPPEPFDITQLPPAADASTGAGSTGAGSTGAGSTGAGSTGASHNTDQSDDVYARLFI